MAIDFTTVLVIFGLFCLVVLLMRLAPPESVEVREDVERGNWR